MASKQAERIFYGIVSIPMIGIAVHCLQGLLVYDAHTSRKAEVEETIQKEYVTNREVVENFWGHRFEVTPALRFELTDAEMMDAGQGMLTNGRHNFGSKDVYISSGVIPSPEDNLLEKVESWLVDSFEPTTVVRHELTHALAAQVGRENDCLVSNKREHRILQEGIATYIEVESGSREREIDCSKPRPTDLQEFHNYNDGFCFVKPILDLDRKEGLVYLLRNPPKEGELLQPATYYEQFSERR